VDADADGDEIRLHRWMLMLMVTLMLMTMMHMSKTSFKPSLLATKEVTSSTLDPCAPGSSCGLDA